MKTARQKKMLELITSAPIDTQEELMSRLKDAGFPVTQATISRDMKDLRIVKTQTETGGYRYICPYQTGNDDRTRFHGLFADNTLSVQSAGNVVAVKTKSGMAQAICAALDAMEQPHVVATLAGDDTIFVLCEDSDKAKQVAKSYLRWIGR